MNAVNPVGKRKKLALPIKIILIVAGLILTALGIIGIVLPILPSTPFFIGATALFLRSSDRLYHWIISNKLTAPFVKKFSENKGMKIKTKLLILGFVWTVLIVTSILIDSLFLKIFLPSLGVIKTVVFFTLIKTVREEKNEIF